MGMSIYVANGKNNGGGRTAGSDIPPRLRYVRPNPFNAR